MSTRTIRVAVAGCGTVGGALLDLLARHGAEHARRSGVRFEVVRILVRDTIRPRSSRVPRDLLTDSIPSFLGTPFDALVEAIGGTEDAGVLVRAALSRGARVVTANKALIRAEGPSLVRLAAQRRGAGATLDFEAAVGGGMPVVRLLRESLAGHGVRSVRGVLNGTTNYLLTRIARGVAYGTALDEARRAGFAERDPSRDLSGTDAADKIAILAWLAFGVDPTRLTVERTPLGAPESIEQLVRAAVQADRVVRLVATAWRTPRGARAAVRPLLLDRLDPLARTHDEENAVQIESESSGAITLTGRGAGGAATASSLLADLLQHAAPLPAVAA
jgi:homoserine dehydrogenase